MDGVSLSALARAIRIAAALLLAPALMRRRSRRRSAGAFPDLGCGRATARRVAAGRRPHPVN
jgi:hypothetical protein